MEERTSECAAQGEAHAASHRHRGEGGGESARIGTSEMQTALIGATEEVDDLVDRIDEEDHYVAQHPRTPEGVVVGHDVALGMIEKLAEETAYDRRDDHVLIGGPLHARLYTEFPTNGGHQGRVEH